MQNCRVGFGHHFKDHDQSPATSQQSLREKVMVGLPWKLKCRELLHHQSRKGHFSKRKGFLDLKH